MKYIPSPVPILCHFIYSAMANKSGRMQYYKTKPGVSRERISRSEFIRLYNETPILALRPLPLKGEEMVFQFEFYV